MHKVLQPQQRCLNHCLLWTFILLHDENKQKTEDDVSEKSKEQKRPNAEEE